MTQNSTHTGKLYVVGTPIGNLGDLSPRVGEAFAAADAICCEDTRVTSKLLMHLGISKPLVRCDENVIASRAVGLVRPSRWRGRPLRFCLGRRACRVCPIPARRWSRRRVRPMCPLKLFPGLCLRHGARFVRHSLRAFFLRGFLGRKHGDRVRRLQRLAVVPGALIFYESPHRIVATLEAVADGLSPA